MWEEIRKDEAFKDFLRIAEDNLHALEVFSRYLNWQPCYVQKEMLESFRCECGLPEKEAYQWLVAAACGLNGEQSERDLRLERCYFPHSIHCLNAEACKNDPYHSLIQMPQVKRGSWRMDVKRIAPYEAIASDDLMIMPDGREIPQIGYFQAAFDTPAVYQYDREWMTVTPSEQNTMLRDVEAVSGNVVVFGLGLGYYPLLISEKENVQQVTVVEIDTDVIELFNEFILPQFPHREKITVVQADAFAYAEEMPRDAYDYAYVDIWHDVLDGVGMYLKMKRIEEKHPQTHFLYWIEKSILCWLRGMAIQEVQDGEAGPMSHTIGEAKTVSELKKKLSNDALAKLAWRIPEEVVQR